MHERLKVLLARMSAGLILFLVCAGVRAQSPPTSITVRGTLIRVNAIGGESTGWAIQFDGHAPVGGHGVASIEVKFNDPKVAERFVDKRVKVKGIVSHRHGVETGDVAVLVVTSIKGVKPAKTAP